MYIGQVSRSNPIMKACVYILRCSNGRYYIGSTNDLDRRIQEHQRGHTASIRYVLPVELVFSQEFDNIQIARSEEYRIKKYKNKEIVERIIQDGRIMSHLPCGRSSAG